jgi:hypothetical protein
MAIDPILHKIKHLRLTMLDYSERNYKLTILPERDRLNYSKDFEFIDKLEKRLLETEKDGYGFEINKEEMKKCNYLYIKYKAEPYNSEA